MRALNPRSRAGFSQQSPRRGRERRSVRSIARAAGVRAKAPGERSESGVTAPLHAGVPEGATAVPLMRKDNEKKRPQTPFAGPFPAIHYLSHLSLGVSPFAFASLAFPLRISPSSAPLRWRFRRCLCLLSTINHPLHLPAIHDPRSTIHDPRSTIHSPLLTPHFPTQSPQTPPSAPPCLPARSLSAPP
jgi:hypothetical protein